MPEDEFGWSAEDADAYIAALDKARVADRVPVRLPALPGASRVLGFPVTDRPCPG